MGFFNWAAPLIRRYGDRFGTEDAAEIASWLRPAVPDGGRLLDLGGGAGALAGLLADELHCRVTVLDPTPELLAYLPARPDVDGLLGTAEAMPLPDGAVDAVVVSDAFHHFADQDGAVRELRRVVRHGGAVLVLEIDPRGWMRLVVWGERLLGEPAAFFTPAGMCAFMAERGIEGSCEPLHGASYRFLGTVR